MEHNIAQLAAKIVAIISPYSPALTGFIKLTGAGLAKWVGEKGGEQLWGVAQRAWATIRSRNTNDVELSSAMNMVGARPDDETRRKELIKILAERFKGDSELTRELEKLFAENVEAVQVVTANQDSTIETVIQEIWGGGKQTITADNRSNVKGVTQKITNR